MEEPMPIFNRKTYSDSDSTDTENDEPKEKKAHCQRAARRCVRSGKPPPLKTGLTETTKACKITAKSAVYSNRVQNCWKKLDVNLKQVGQVEDLGSDVEDEHVLHTKKSTSEKISNGQKNEFSVNNDEEIVCTGMDESLDLEVIDDHDRSLKLPSPPPPPDILVVNKNSTKGITKKTRKALKTLENAKALLEDSGDTDSCYLDSYDLTSPIREDIIIKVNCRGEVLRLEAKKSEPFSSIIKKIAKVKNVESKQIKLYRNEESENSITDYDTPASLNLTVADILCCLIVSKYSNYSHISTIDQKKSGGFKLFVQSNNSRENKVEIEIEKTHHLQELMFKYASIKKSDISKFRFVFDGEDISPLETAEDLAMEDGDTIDAVEISAIEIS